jgi:hypothetical protein
MSVPASLYDSCVQTAVVINLFHRFAVSGDVTVQLSFVEGLQKELRPKMSWVRGMVARARMLKPLLDNWYPRVYPVRVLRACGFCSVLVYYLQQWD